MTEPAKGVTMFDVIIIGTTVIVSVVLGIFIGKFF